MPSAQVGGNFQEDTINTADIEQMRRQELQVHILGGHLLESQKRKLKVRAAASCRQIKLHLSGNKLLVRCGGGYLELLEFLQRKGFLVAAAQAAASSATGAKQAAAEHVSAC